MKAPLTTQRTPAPTRKMTAAMAGTALLAVIQVLVHNFAPGFDQPYLWPALMPVTVFAFSYFVRDRANY